MKCFGECGSKVILDQKAYLDLANFNEDPLEILIAKEEKNNEKIKIRRNE